MGKTTTKDLLKIDAGVMALVAQLADRVMTVEADIADIESLFAKLAEDQPQHPIADAYLQFYNTERN